jgi:antitoxin component YwqK of YwqJK toxin-antitoxin module
MGCFLFLLYMKKVLINLCVIAFLLGGCGVKKTGPKKIDVQWLNEIKKNSDSIYTKPYYRTDFVTAEYFCNRKDSSICQIMKDSSGAIRQVIMTKKNSRTFFAQYYKNGQLQADLPLDNFGQYNGESTSYFENGKVQSLGEYVHGLKIGDWKIYDTTGKLLFVEAYNKNGQLLKTIQQ